MPVEETGQLDVIIVGRHHRSLDGVRVRSLARLPRSEFRRLHGLPLTAPSLTLLDLERLVVEVDGYRYHSTYDRFVSDRRRIAELGTLGYAVFPLTWLDLTEQPGRSMRRLRETLAARRAQLLPRERSA